MDIRSLQDAATMLFHPIPTYLQCPLLRKVLFGLGQLNRRVRDWPWLAED